MNNPAKRSYDEWLEYYGEQLYLASDAGLPKWKTLSQTRKAVWKRVAEKAWNMFQPCDY